MKKEMLKFIYGTETKEKGLEKAFKDIMQQIESCCEEAKVLTKNEISEENVDFAIKLQEAEVKLNIIGYSLMLKDVIDRKEKITALIDELENIVAELKELETNE